MTPLERMQSLLAGRAVDKIPFVPAIYEHKAFLIDKTPSEVARDPELLYQALRTEYELYQPDLLVVGLDVYNIEAEALGAKVKYYKTPDTPTIVTSVSANINNMRIPNPSRDGRMPLMIKAGKEALQSLGMEVMIWGAMSGPFTLAANLLGKESFLLKLIKYKDYAHKIMKFCTRVLIEYAKAWVDAGLGVIVFDSFCAPPMISPALYRQLVLPYHAKLMDFLSDLGLPYHPLIIGGNTTAIVQDIIKTGANFIICDYNADLEHYMKVIANMEIALRVNINPGLIYQGPVDKIIRVGKELVVRANSLSRFILGTGVLPYNTPQEHVLALKSCIGE